MFVSGNTYAVRVVIRPLPETSRFYAWPGLYFVRFDRDLDGSGREKAVAGLGRCGSQQRHHLLHRDADGAVRLRPRQPVLHGPLRK